MHATLSLKKNPNRRPQWRADRAIELTENPRARLQSADDRYVRAYRRYLRMELDARDDTTKLYCAFLALPAPCLVQKLYYAADKEFRFILEARLLTQESFGVIANRLQIEERTVAHFKALFFIEERMIAHYEALFFNVRERLHNTAWIQEVILGPPEYLIVDGKGRINEDQRGFLYFDCLISIDLVQVFSY